MAMFALVDCNSFYCACESLFQPALRGKAVVVLSNNDGCVIARSAQAKALGIKMGTPAFQLADVRRASPLEVFSSNYTLYGDMSRRVMEVLAGFAPLEVYSIDEAFLNLDHVAAAHLDSFGRELKSVVGRGTGIPVGVGIGPTKTLAKLANDLAKATVAACGGVRVLTAGDVATLAATPCADVWGLSGGFTARLARLGIRTALELARAPRAAVRRACGVVVERTALELSGVSCLELEESPACRKNLCVSRSFGRATDDAEEIREAVATHASRAGEKLRAQGLAAAVLAVFLHTDPHRPEQPQHFPQAARELETPTSFTPTLVGLAGDLAAGMFQRGHRYKKAGVLALGLVAEGDQVQGHLWQSPDTERQRRLMAAVDTVNARHGRHAVRCLSCGGAGVHGPPRAWHLRASRRSPPFTTRFDDVPLVRAG